MIKSYHEYNESFIKDTYRKVKGYLSYARLTEREEEELDYSIDCVTKFKNKKASRQNLFGPESYNIIAGEIIFSDDILRTSFCNVKSPVVLWSPNFKFDYSVYSGSRQAIGMIDSKVCVKWYYKDLTIYDFLFVSFSDDSTYKFTSSNKCPIRIIVAKGGKGFRYVIDNSKNLILGDPTSGTYELGDLRFDGINPGRWTTNAANIKDLSGRINSNIKDILRRQNDTQTIANNRNKIKEILEKDKDDIILTLQTIMDEWGEDLSVQLEDDPRSEKIGYLITIGISNELSQRLSKKETDKRKITSEYKAIMKEIFMVTSKLEADGWDVHYNIDKPNNIFIDIVKKNTFK